MILGSHLSIAGGMENALLEARRLDMQGVQVFTKNQRQWKVQPLASRQIDAWHKTLDETGIVQPVSHDSYLINLASPPGENRRKSIALFEEEIRRCDLLNIPWLVTHPGAHLGDGEQTGIARIVDALNRLHDKLPNAKVITALEVTAGQGTTLGHRFEHLAAIIEQVEAPQRLAVCLDTAHLIAAGYNLTSRSGAQAVLREADRVFGLDRVKVIHINDSKAPRGSRVDRHEHIGHGHVSPDAFAVFLRSRRLRHVPFILETPKQDTEDGRPWDAVNLRTLRELANSRSVPRKST